MPKLTICLLLFKSRFLSCSYIKLYNFWFFLFFVFLRLLKQNPMSLLLSLWNSVPEVNVCRWKLGCIYFLLYLKIKIPVVFQHTFCKKRKEKKEPIIQVAVRNKIQHSKKLTITHFIGVKFTWHFIILHIVYSLIL